MFIGLVSWRIVCRGWPGPRSPGFSRASGGSVSSGCAACPSELRELLAGKAQPVIYSRPVMPEASATIVGLADPAGM
jgi:hypothetical protein